VTQTVGLSKIFKFYKNLKIQSNIVMDYHAGRYRGLPFIEGWHLSRNSEQERRRVVYDKATAAAIFLRL